MNLPVIDFPSHGDQRGQLVAIEAGAAVPFEIRRIYYIYGTREGIDRGFHAHKSLRQVAIAVCGSCQMVLDDGKDRATVHLDSPSRGIYIAPGMWHVMTCFSRDCVLVVLADQHYDADDYIRDYEEFKDWVKRNHT